MQDPAFYGSGLDAVVEELPKGHVARRRAQRLAKRFWDAGAELKAAQTASWDVLQAAAAAGSTRAQRMLDTMYRSDVT